MESGTPPKAPSSKPVHNTEASSQKDPGQGGKGKTVKAAPGGQTSGAGLMGKKIPMGADGGGHPEFGSHPDAIPEIYTAPESSRQPPSAGGVVPAPSATSVQPEVSDALLVASQDASIVDEHRAPMGAVIEKIQSAESGLNEACINLIRGFEVCFMMFRRMSWYR